MRSIVPVDGGGEGDTLPVAQFLQRQTGRNSIVATPPNSAVAGTDKRTDSLVKGAPAAYERRDVSNGFLIKWMFGFVRPVKLASAMACFWTAMGVGGEVAMSWQFANLVNSISHLQGSRYQGSFSSWVGSGDPTWEALSTALWQFSFIVFAFCIFRYCKEVSIMKMSMQMVYYIREAVYDKLQRVGFGYHDQISTGQLINRALSDLNAVRQFLMTAVLQTLEISLVVVGYILVLSTKNATVALASLVPLPVWVWYILRFSKRVQPVAKSVMEAQDKNISILSENVQGVHVVKAFATEGLEIDKYNRNSDVFFERVIRRIRMFANFTPVIRAIATTSHLSLYFITAIMVLAGKMSPGDMLFVAGAMGAILGRLQQIDAINQQYQAAIVSARRLYEVLAANPTVPEKPDAKPLPAGPGTVRFENVSFGYDPAKPVVKNLNFDVPGGSIVALVGPTGAGKSTLVNLISRFYDPQQGRVLIDGVDIRDCTLSSVRTQVALVFQETYLFSDTIENNIAYGRPHIKGGEVEAAARLAQAHEFIENTPKGYQTVLAERGSSLSGGQRQRLAIARAILCNPRVLILDDATASVDPETEGLIQKALDFVMKGKTTFLIAHRISTVKRADIVMVIEKGQITQIGKHSDLMRQSGHYREIAEAQLYGEGDSAPPPQSEHPSALKRNVAMVQARDEGRPVQPAPSSPRSPESQAQAQSQAQSGAAI